MLARSIDHVLELVRAGDLHAASGWAWIRGLCDGRWHRNRSRSRISRGVVNCVRRRVRRRDNSSISKGICLRDGRPIRGDDRQNDSCGEGLIVAYSRYGG
jgi:hypothetical protein